MNCKVFVWGREATDQLYQAISLFSNPLVLESLTLANFGGLDTNLGLKLFDRDWRGLSLGGARVPYSGFMRTLESDLCTLLGEDMGNSFLGSVCDHLKEHGYLIHTE